MNLTEYLLTQLADESVEIAQRCHKAQQFGLDETQEGQPENNVQRIQGEITDFMAVYEMLVEIGAMPAGRDRRAVQAKKVKVMKYAKYALDQGTLDLRGEKDVPLWNKLAEEYDT